MLSPFPQYWGVASEKQRGVRRRRGRNAHVMARGVSVGNGMIMRSERYSPRSRLSPLPGTRISS